MPRGRPPLDEAALQARVAAYCRRYGTALGETGLPPFPAGRRETAQHRHWLAIYRADKRLRLREAAAASPAGSAASAASSAPDSSAAPSEAAASRCPICRRPLADAGVAFSAGRRREPLVAHAACADLARGVEALGAPAAARLLELLWGRRR